jgi:hypothetical protein
VVGMLLSLFGGFLGLITKVADAVKFLLLFTGFTIGMAGQVASDPPDGRFTIIAQPRMLSFSPLTPGDGLTPDAADALNAMLGNYAQAVSVGEAFLTSLERVQGAGLAGDIDWYGKQMAAASGYAMQQAAVLDAQPALNATAESSWRASGLLDVSADDVAAAQDDLALNGLPAPFADLVNEVGEHGQAFADELTKELIALDTSTISGGLPAILNDPTFNATLHAAAHDLGTAFAPPPPCGGDSCDDGDPCTTDSCPADACQHSPLSGAAAVCSACQGGLKSPACTGQPVPAMVAQRFTHVCGLEARVGTSKPKKAKKLAQQAVANVRKASALVRKAAKRHKGAISAECAAVIAGALQGQL